MRTPKPSQKVLDRISGVDRTEYDAILEELRRKHAPANIDERCLVDSLAYDVWTSRRMVLFRTTCAYDSQNPELNAMLDMARTRLAVSASNYTRTLKLLTRCQRSRIRKPQPAESRASTEKWVN